ncbi:MAG TPA: hypothetical protein VF026_07400 [Ktedonobacteraceae bacterium]
MIPQAKLSPEALINLLLKLPFKTTQEEESRRLKRELEVTRQERDILL